MVLLVVNVNGRDDVFFRDGTGNTVALFVQPFDCLYVCLNNLFISAEMKCRDGAESAELFEFGLVTSFVDLDADLEITVGFEELLQRIVVIS